ncbi:hypothetical protein F5883DRAFT_578091 [Diaporthe sp. PMI_573]|nr:hypothetical protein F5883DRAFT_578091 [Diaporthaceae sp. PMI_573]
MEWIQDDCLLGKEDLHILRFPREPKQSTILAITGGPHGDCSTTEIYPNLVSPERWHECLDSLHERSESFPHKRVTILFGGRTTSRLGGNEVSNLPFERSLCPRVVSDFQIYRSIARVINRNTTATCCVTSTRHPDSGQELQIYNCRSSAEWKEDMALSVTYSHDTQSTKAVLYGCTESTREWIIHRLKSCNYVVYHPLAIPALFCDIERNRQFELVDPITNKLSDRALKIAKPQPPGSPSLRLTRSNTTTWAQGTEAKEDSEDLMSLWLEASDLKRGLQTWKHELEKLIVYSDELAQDRLRRGSEGSEDPEQRHFIEAGRRIRQQLLELNGEYDQKIRQCTDIIEGMVLAAQLEWNNIGQEDTRTNLNISGTNIAIAKATQADSRQMRSISVLTMVFLPATFVATVFSMTFFNWSPEQDEKILSPWFWIYVVITVAFTLVTMCIWLIFNRRMSKSRKNDLESGSIISGITISASEQTEKGDQETVASPLRRLMSHTSSWGKGQFSRSEQKDMNKTYS